MKKMLEENCEELIVELKGFSGNSMGPIILDLEKTNELINFLEITKCRMTTKVEYYNGNDIIIKYADGSVNYVSSEGISVHENIENLNEHFNNRIPLVFGLDSDIYTKENAKKFFHEFIENKINLNKNIYAVKNLFNFIEGY